MDFIIICTHVSKYEHRYCICITGQVEINKNRYENLFYLIFNLF